MVTGRDRNLRRFKSQIENAAPQASFVPHINCPKSYKTTFIGDEELIDAGQSILNEHAFTIYQRVKGSLKWAAHQLLYA